jgi:hypothetical protein
VPQLRLHVCVVVLQAVVAGQSLATIQPHELATQDLPIAELVQSTHAPAVPQLVVVLAQARSTATAKSAAARSGAARSGVARSGTAKSAIDRSSADAPLRSSSLAESTAPWEASWPHPAPIDSAISNMNRCVLIAHP